MPDVPPASRQIYVDAEWPRGLRCMDCGCLFVDGMPVCERLYAMTSLGEDPVACVEVICGGCEASPSESDA